MGGKQSSVTTERYQSPTATIETTPSTIPIHPPVPLPQTRPPPLPSRNYQSQDPRPVPTPDLSQTSPPFFLSQPTDRSPPHFSGTDNSLAGQFGYNHNRPLSEHRFANRPLPTLPNQPSSSNRSERFLDIEAFLAGLNEISNQSESHRDRSVSHHRHHRPRHRDRNFSAARTRETSRDLLLDDPLSFLRSLTRTRCCPNCSEVISIEDYQNHVSKCSTLPAISYNEDTLVSDGGECTICLEDMTIGNHIARLPCLCTYHITCIQDWFKVKATCPQHPDLDFIKNITK